MWTDELKVIRRYLRDPDARIWDDAYLRHMWNDVQKDLQNRTHVLEEVVAQRVPDLYHLSYMHDWEWRHLPSRYSDFYQCLNKHDGGVFCHSWEPQQVAGTEVVFVTITLSGGDGGYLPSGYLPTLPEGYLPGGDGSEESSEVTFSGSVDADDIGCHFTHPWEAFMGLEPGEEVRLKFPRNMKQLRFIAYDEEPILSTTRKMVQSCDSSYISRTGNPIAYFETDGVSKEFVLYPRPSTAWTDEIDNNDGLAFLLEDDSEDVSSGMISVRTGSSDTGFGASVDVIGLTDNVLLIYDVNPQDIQSNQDEGDFPAFLRKYLRYGVISRAYDANTDGRIPSLARLWAQRYELGVRAVKRYMLSRSNDRDYRLSTGSGTSRTRRRVPRLPDSYPAV